MNSLISQNFDIFLKKPEEIIMKIFVPQTKGSVNVKTKMMMMSLNSHTLWTTSKNKYSIKDQTRVSRCTTSFIILNF